MTRHSTQFYSQPLAHRFGMALRECLADAGWQSFDTAVAWVRQSGTRHIEAPLKAFLGRGGSATFCIGLDSHNTSKEGLQSLLSLERHGYAQVYVHHNEASVIYHPKVYLFSNEDRARLIVGSNNLTEAGLFRNTEAGLQLDADRGDPVISQASQALAAWRDTTTPFVRRLDDALLNDLVDRKYVFPEKVLRKDRDSTRPKHADGERLFGFREISVPPVPGGGDATTPPEAVGSVLLMRVRRASETERRTQIQVPIRVVRTGFFGADVSVRSAHDSRVHTIRRAEAGGATNTMKLELPEIDPMTDPVVRFERTAVGIEYQVYDATSTLGTPVMEAMERGRRMAPPATHLTLPDNPRSSTWWRFV